MPINPFDLEGTFTCPRCGSNANELSADGSTVRCMGWNHKAGQPSKCSYECLLHFQEGPTPPREKLAIEKQMEARTADLKAALDLVQEAAKGIMESDERKRCPYCQAWGWSIMYHEETCPAALLLRRHGRNKVFFRDGK